MRVEVLTTKLAFGKDFSELVQEKIKPLERFVKRFEEQGEIIVYVEIARTSKHHKHGDVYYAEATMSLGGKTLRVEQYDSDINNAINLLKDRLRLALSKHKERFVSERKRTKKQI